MEKRKHILILSSWYPTAEHRFLGNFVERFAKLLAKEYQISLIHTVASNAHKSLSVDTTNAENFTEIRVFHPKGANLFQRKKRQLNALKHGFGLVKDVDLIIGNVILPRGIQFVKAKKHYRVPLIVVEHGSYYRQEIRRKWNAVEKYILKKTSKHIDRLVAVSEFLKNDMQPIFGTTTIDVIGNAVDSKLFSLKQSIPKEPHFLHVSTLDKKTKNPNGIIEACSLLNESSMEFKMTIVCDEDVTEWRQLAVQKGLQNKIDFVGPLEWSEIVPYYHQASAFVLFSNYETFSIVLAEAWLTGTPTITTAVGIASKLDPELGMLVEKNNVEELASAMMSVSKDINAYQPEKIRAFALQYDEATILAQWKQLIATYVK